VAFKPIGTSARGIRSPDGQQILRQTYDDDGVPKLPEGVVVVPLRVWPDDWGGTFKEAVRLECGVVQAPALRDRGVQHQVAQVNVSVISPGGKRFWHLHPTQSEMWTISYGQLNAGLIDCRERSPTYGVKAKVVLTPDRGLFIPAGVAHGFANESTGVVVLQYLVDRQFSATEDTEEWRLDPKELPYDFVLAEVI
jgi:dTDP-4-dehydrorhamnose 3,5-epimerase-like enzyme